MADNKIKKALECCSKGVIQDCFECPLQNSWDCHKQLRENALDIINRQQAEIEKLTEERDKERQYAMHYAKMCAKEHSEAIKEFAERLKAKACSHNCRYFGNVYDIKAVEIKEIDNLVAEMTEQSVNYRSSKNDSERKAVCRGEDSRNGDNNDFTLNMG